MVKKKEILILGAGVSGLSTGILLLKKGYSVKIWARELSPNTTSDTAAAIWYPYLCSPREKAIPWAKITFKYLLDEILPDSKGGCIRRRFSEIFDSKQPEPWWREAFPDAIDRLGNDQLPEGYIDAYSINTIVIDTSIYMKYLADIFNNLGGTIIQKEVNDINEAFEENNVVINCTGLGSRNLFNDMKVFPVRGQMIKIKKTEIDEIIVDDTAHNNLSLIVPRLNDVMLGGTAQVNDWNLNIDSKDTEEILRKALLLQPKLGEIEIVSESVGLRPARESIRLEPEYFGEKVVIHNYGHGGAGFTLSWGCAADVVLLVEKYSSTR